MKNDIIIGGIKTESNIKMLKLLIGRKNDTNYLVGKNGITQISENGEIKYNLKQFVSWEYRDIRKLEKEKLQEFFWIKMGNKK